MDWTNWVALIGIAVAVVTIAWFAVLGFVRHRKELNKGSIGGDNWSNPGNSINGPF